MKEKAQKLFDEAIQKLREANDELCRPEEDVVRSLVCSNSHDAIEKYLKGFLALNSIEPNDEESIDGLYQKCKKVNHHFEEVHLSGFECNAHKDDSRFHNEPSELSRCFDIADSLDTFLRREKIIG
ncbi:HEPN domain-containing protein [Flagellimonas nanhaiensis]|uniref:HEPN domain-containing protein n=1 Tax=Flagellimonas nanhaiensis TaxID=2292706 RepID=A0A371JPQ3_9FLAO|nr:HEPN domain-containing protein [Allomuricauda nanhaiensis]RDY59484.1 HEPN domain-containing protein [Allomuricauda nanhaiensis]